jgi:hypothetical protein
VSIQTEALADTFDGRKVEQGRLHVQAYRCGAGETLDEVRVGDARRADWQLACYYCRDTPSNQPEHPMTPATTDLELRAGLSALTRILRKLHKALIDVETQYFGAVGSPLEHLQLITNHPHFAWLQKLSGLMVELDERLDQPEPMAPEEGAAFRSAIEMLIGPGEARDVEFFKKYNALLHDSPDIVMAHAAVRQSLETLPLRRAQ